MSDRWIPKIGERVSIADKPGTTAKVLAIVHDGDEIVCRVMPDPGQHVHPVTEESVRLEKLAPHPASAR